MNQWVFFALGSAGFAALTAIFGKLSHNIKEIVDSWKKDRKIGTSHPRDKKKGMEQAVAISLKKAGKSKYPNK